MIILGPLEGVDFGVGGSILAISTPFDPLPDPISTPFDPLRPPFRPPPTPISTIFDPLGGSTGGGGTI